VFYVPCVVVPMPSVEDPYEPGELLGEPLGGSYLVRLAEYQLSSDVVFVGYAAFLLDNIFEGIYEGLSLIVCALEELFQSTVLAWIVC